MSDQTPVPPSPAFPQNDESVAFDGAEGISARLYVASRAMEAILSRPDTRCSHMDEIPEVAERTAEMALQFADALLAAAVPIPD